jgi:hypothetical protein
VLRLRSRRIRSGGCAEKPCWHAQAIAILEQAGLYRREVETAPLGRPVAERIAAARTARYTAALDSVNELYS